MWPLGLEGRVANVVMAATKAPVQGDEMSGLPMDIDSIKKDLRL